MRLVLASASPARRRCLERAGVEPRVIVSGIDEDQITAPTPKKLAGALAEAKARQVLAEHGPGAGSAAIEEPYVLVACDTLVELDGRPCGKPGSREAVIAQWQQMRGREALVHTGHHVWLVDGHGEPRSASRVVTTTVSFADLSDAEIEAYASTSEPAMAAGGFSIDGLAGPFVTSITGDPSNVIGISLPVLRQLLLDLGVAWQELWA